MHRKPEGLLQTAMRSLRRPIFLSLTLLLVASGTGIYAQGSGNKGGVPCFSIHVRLNGKVVEGPLRVTFKTKNGERSTVQEGGCFRVPPDVLSEQAVDVLFTVPGNNVHLSAVAPGFFAGPWDVELEDKHFSKDMVLPKHARVKDACGVVFHLGEPERAITQTSCRTPF
jgi:hypothetical protein